MWRWLVGLLGVALMGLVPHPVSASPTSDRHQIFRQRFEAFVDRLRRDPSAPPGFVVVVVDRSDTVFERAYGTRDLRSQDPLTLDAPIYTASTTKSFVGLLAAQLDAIGELSLDATLTDVWPKLTLPIDRNPGSVTARSLLSHVSGIESPVLSWLYSDTGAYRSDRVPSILRRYATRANRAYDYGNIGPVIYSAMADARLGTSWRDALQRYVARPLGLSHTSARLEDFPPASIARCHARWGGAWTVIQPKPTVLMDAGGGVLSSGRDAGAYLRAFTSEGASTNGRVSAAVLRRTYQREAAQDREFFGFHRTGYGLGWDLSQYRSHSVVSRSGGYPGCRSMMVFLPEHHFGVLVFSLSDAGANLFNTSLIQQAIDYRIEDPDADARAADRIAAFAMQAAAAVAAADAIPITPTERTANATAEHAGRYVSPGFGEVVISLSHTGLEASAGVMRLLLAPGERDSFAAYDADTPGDPQPLTFRRDAHGAIDAFVYRETIFLKRAR